MFDLGCKCEIFVKSKPGVVALALVFGVAIEFFSDLIDVDPDMTNLGPKTGKLFHYIGGREVSREDPNGAVFQNVADKGTHVVERVLF